MYKKAIISLVVTYVTLHPASVFAQGISGWVPWWAERDGVESATARLDELDTVHPFVFEVRTDGTLVDKAGLDDALWQDFFKKARRNGVDIIPTITWSDSEAIRATLHNETARKAHVSAIVAMVHALDVDGVNIDYENKFAETKDYFSIFLKELKVELGSDTLACAVEARTPAASKWREVPAVLEYANDFAKIGTYCDEVEIMAYDQQRADLKLNDARKGMPYFPVADIAWVEKVIAETVKEIPAEKIMLGVATYGRNATVTVAPEWYKDYKSNGAISVRDADVLAKKYSVTAGRNVAGEKSFSYFPEDSIFKILNTLETPAGTPRGMEAAAKALLFATYAKMEVPVNIVWYSDASAIEDKKKVAKKYGLKGIAIFKIDGKEDLDI